MPTISNNQAPPNGNLDSEWKTIGLPHPVRDLAAHRCPQGLAAQEMGESCDTRWAVEPNNNRNLSNKDGAMIEICNGQTWTIKNV